MALKLCLIYVLIQDMSLPCKTKKYILEKEVLQNGMGGLYFLPSKQKINFLMLESLELNNSHYKAN